MARTEPGKARQASCRADSASAPRPARPAIGRHRAGPVQTVARNPDRSQFRQRLFAGWMVALTNSLSRLTVVEPAGPGFRAACSHGRRAHRNPGKMRVRGRWAQVPDYRYPLMVNGVAVVSAPAEIDIVNAEQ